jgi:PDZ domain/Aspartyl protease
MRPRLVELSFPAISPRVISETGQPEAMLRKSRLTVSKRTPATSETLIMPRSILMILGTALATLVLSASARHAAIGAESADVIDSFPVETNGDVLLVPITLGDRQYQFVIDTGSSVTCFDSSLKTALQATGERKSIITRHNTRRREDFYTCPGASVGTARLPLGQAVICDDLALFRSASGNDIQGFLGMDFLGEYVLQLDFDGGRVRILKSSDGVPGLAVPIVFDAWGRPQLTVDLSDSARLSFLINTGSTGYVTGSMHSEIFESLNRLKILTVHGQVACPAVNGFKFFRCGVVEKTMLSGFEHEQQTFCEGESNSLALGYLARYTMTLDFPRSRVFLAPGRRFDRPPDTNQSGVYLVRIDGRVVVARVDPGGLGHTSGIREGDRIVKINGIDAESMKLHAARSLMRDAVNGLPLTVIAPGDTESRDISIRRTPESKPAAK